MQRGTYQWQVLLYIYISQLKRVISYNTSYPSIRPFTGGYNSIYDHRMSSSFGGSYISKVRWSVLGECFVTRMWKKSRDFAVLAEGRREGGKARLKRTSHLWHLRLHTDRQVVFQGRCTFVKVRNPFWKSIWQYEWNGQIFSTNNLYIYIYKYISINIYTPLYRYLVGCMSVLLRFHAAKPRNSEVASHIR